MTRDLFSKAASPFFRGLILIAVVAGFAAMLAVPMGCKGNGSGSGCLFFEQGELLEFDSDDEDGWDDTSSPGAALGVAIDNSDGFAAMSIAMRFSAVTAEQSFQPTCNTADSITSYDFAAANSVNLGIAVDFPLIAPVLTDTDGVRGMQNNMTAFLVRFSAEDGFRVYVAVAGRITLRRTGGGSPENRVFGSLTFAQMTEANDEAEVLDPPITVTIDDIDFTWDTAEQPI